MIETCTQIMEDCSQWEGQVVNGEFHLQKYLGGSSASAAFLAEQRGQVLRQTVIKLIPVNAADKNLYLSRWSAAESVSHPRLIRVFEKGRCELGGVDLFYFVMEYAEENLAEIMLERALTPAEVRDLLDPVLDALNYLHGRGFAHGHLKPSNVLAAGDQVKLSSDGVLRPGSAAFDPERLSVYDPPEMARGEISPAADVWSLGMTLVEVLTQRPPSWKDKEQSDPIVPENLPAPFLDIVRGCLRRDPRQRLTTAAIAELLHPHPARPLPRPQTAVPPQRRPRHRSLVAPMVMALLAVAVLYGGLGLLRRAPDSQQSVPKPRPAPRQESQRRPAQSPDQPANPSYLPVAASRAKPSPASDKRNQPPATTARVPENPAPVITHASANRDVLREVLPDVPQKAKDTIQGTIRVGVKVQVDPSGNVVGTELETPGPSKYFARLSTQAAQGWKFAPSGQDVERQFVLSFDFRNTEITAAATRAP